MLRDGRGGAGYSALSPIQTSEPVKQSKLGENSREDRF